jgi:peptide deformylase
MLAMAPYRIRTFGDSVLRRRAAEVAEIDGRIAQLAEDMHITMKEAHGLGLAAPQVGVSRRLFVYEIGNSGPRTLVNPVISEREGDWEHEEGCLSVPQLFFWVQRPMRVHVTGYDLDGREVSIEAEELEATLYQHEVDHLDGKLLLHLLDDDQRKDAMRELRRRAAGDEQTRHNGVGRNAVGREGMGRHGTGAAAPK